MLQRLHIRNYAIIDELEIEFEPGLNIITGETGAGKSILIGALGLVLGSRADTSVLFEAGEKCFVEASFYSPDKNVLKAVMEALELDADDTVILRREIAANGKSRSFVNDTPVTLQGLRQVAGLLVDLHRQFDTMTLAEDSFQFEVLDALAGHHDLVKQYADAYRDWRKAETAFKKLKEQQESSLREMDYTRFLFNELEEANLQPFELETLETEVKLLSNAENIKASLTQVSYALDESDPSLVQQIKQLANILAGTVSSLPGLSELSDRLHSVHIELQDIAQELIRINDRVGMDPEKLNLANERLSLGYKLLKKHQVGSTSELLALQEDLADKLLQFTNLDEAIAKKGKEMATGYKNAITIAEKISLGRQKILKPLEDTTTKYLGQMGMPNARLQAVCTTARPAGGDIVLGMRGIDAVQLLFDANKTGRFEPIEKVASGGELSRLMLAIKAQVAKSINLPALIFDEIDTGISGEAARQVGLLMKQLATGHQVIAITHQPQIAARAHAHYFVYKKEANGAVKTRLRKLEPQERVDAIAQMLSGEVLSDSARKIAREMLETA